MVSMPTSWPSIQKVMTLREFMDVDSNVTMTDLASRRRPKFLLKDIFSQDPCQILHSHYMTNAKVPPVNSASDSIIVIADLNLPEGIAYNDIIFKITFASRTGANQYEIEDTVYRELSKYDLPFVMQHLKTYKCSHFQQLLTYGRQSQSLSKLFQDQKLTWKEKSECITSIKNLLLQIKRRWWDLKEYHFASYDWTQAQIIVCERGRGCSLADKIVSLTTKNENLDENDWVAIFIQVMFCLAFFEQINLMHHDLHLGNVWLDTTDHKVKYYLNVGASLPIVFTTDYIVKVYDFDHAALGGYTNTLLERNCYHVGECNVMNIGRDYAQFCWWLNTCTLVPDSIKDTIKRSVDKEFLANTQGHHPGSLSWSGHPCVHVMGHSCNPYQNASVVENIRIIANQKSLYDSQSTDYGSKSILYLPNHTPEHKLVRANAQSNVWQAAAFPSTLPSLHR